MHRSFQLRVSDQVITGLALLDSGALRANYIHPDFWARLQAADPTMELQVLERPAYVKVANDTPVLVSGNVTLLVGIHAPDNSFHTGTIVCRVAQLTTDVDLFVGLPTLCTTFKSLMIQCLESYAPDAAQKLMSLGSDDISAVDHFAQLIPPGPYVETTPVWTTTLEQTAPEESLFPPESAFHAFITEHNYDTNRQSILNSWRSKLFSTTLIAVMEKEQKEAWDSFCQYMDKRGFLAFMPGPEGWKFIKGVKASLDLAKPLPPAFPPRPPTFPPRNLREQCDRYIQTLLSYFWEPSDATTLTPILIVPKPGSEVGIRIVSMYNLTINDYLLNYVWAIPSALWKISNLIGCIFFAVADLTRAFHQIELTIEASKALSVTTHRGNFRPKGIPEGVKFGSQFLQQVVQQVFSDTEDFCDAIFDNLFLYAKSIPEMLDHLKVVFERCIEHHIILNIDKTNVGTSQMQFGMLIDAKGYQADPSRVDGIRRMTTPTNKKKARAALGLFNWLSPFVHNYASYAAPIYDMTKEGFNFDRKTWTKDYDTAFAALVCACSDSLLKIGIPDYSKEWITYQDASDVACCGIIVMLDEDGKQVPLQVVSHKWSDVATRWVIMQKEAWAIFYNYKKGYNLLYGKEHKLMTDNANLLAMEKSPRVVIQNIVLYLQTFNIAALLHVAGTKNPADHPTRADLDDGFNTQDESIPTKEVFSVLPQSMVASVAEQVESSLFKQSDEELLFLSHSMLKMQPDYQNHVGNLIHDGLTMNQAVDSLYILSVASSTMYDDGFNFDHLAYEIDEIAMALSESEALEAFRKSHSYTNGHWGLSKTMNILNRDYPNHGISTETVSKWLLSCYVCAKSRKHAHPAVVPINRTLRKFEDGIHDTDDVVRMYISSDFLSLPTTPSGNCGATVISNSFSKTARIYPQRDNTAESLAKSFLLHYSRTGGFCYVRSDQGTDYMSNTFRDLRQLLGRSESLFVHIPTIAYRPQGHGTEPVNKQIVECLRRCINDPKWPFESEWDHPLAIACIEMAINFTRNTSTGHIPIAIEMGEREQYFELPTDEMLSKIPDCTHSVTLRQFSAQFRTIRHLLLENHSALHSAATKDNQLQPQDLLQPGTLVLHSDHKPDNKLRFIRSGPHEVVVHRPNTNDVQVKDLVRDIYFDVHSQNLSLFHGSYEDALAAARLDYKHYVVVSILGYRGDPTRRTTMKFLVLFDDGEQHWRSYDKDLDETSAYETFCTQRHELKYLLRPQAAMASTRRYLRHHPLVIPPGATCYVDLRSWGYEWYDSDAFELPDKHTHKYVVLGTYGHTTSHLGIARIEVSFQIFAEYCTQRNGLDFEWVTLWGSYSALCPDWTLVDDQFAVTHPQVFPDKQRSKLIVAAQRRLGITPG